MTPNKIAEAAPIIQADMPEVRRKHARERAQAVDARRGKVWTRGEEAGTMLLHTRLFMAALVPAFEATIYVRKTAPLTGFRLFNTEQTFDCEPELRAVEASD